MNETPDASLDDTLRTLAADDTRVVVPRRVETTVMQAWDTQQAAGAIRRARRSRQARLWMLVSAAAAVVVGAVLLQRDSARDRADAPTAIDFGYVIVPDPLADPRSLQVVRLRMPRAGLASLGLPIVNPEAGGLVDVELLVGEDGVARSIRRAALVTGEVETGGEP